MADVNILDYVPTIKSILESSDLHEITAKEVRIKLEQKFKVNLAPRKQEVQQLIDDCFDELVSSSEETELKISKKPKKQHSNSEEKLKKSSTDKSKKSRPKGRPPKTQVKVRESDYSSLEDDSPPQKKKRGRKPKGSSVRTESSDAEFERKFEEVLLNESNEKRSKSKSNGTSKKKSSKRKKRDDDEQDGEERKKRKKGNTGIHKPLILSSVLAEFLQAEEMSRLEVVKRLWAYIKENELQDPNDKRFIVCDERLMTIFKQDRIHSFTMNKFLTVHLTKKEAPAMADSNRTAVKYENHSNVGGDNDLDDISKDEGVEDIKVEMETQESWTNLDNEDNEENEDNEDNEDNNEDNGDNEDEEDLFGEEDAEWVKPEEDDDDKSQE